MAFIFHRRREGLSFVGWPPKSHPELPHAQEVLLRHVRVQDQPGRPPEEAHNEGSQCPGISSQEVEARTVTLLSSVLQFFFMLAFK